MDSNVYSIVKSGVYLDTSTEVKSIPGYKYCSLEYSWMQEQYLEYTWIQALQSRVYLDTSTVFQSIPGCRNSIWSIPVLYCSLEVDPHDILSLNMIHQRYHHIQGVALQQQHYPLILLPRQDLNFDHASQIRLKFLILGPRQNLKLLYLIYI